jgi:ribosomal protein S27AE
VSLLVEGEKECPECGFASWVIDKYVDFDPNYCPKCGYCYEDKHKKTAEGESQDG